MFVTPFLGDTSELQKWFKTAAGFVRTSSLDLRNPVRGRKVNTLAFRRLESRPVKAARMGSKRRKKKHRQTMGSAPGTLEAAPGAKDTEISLITYSEDEFKEAEVTQVSGDLFKKSKGVLWLNFEGLGDVKSLSLVGDLCGVHRLALEDIIYSDRPRADDFENFLFLSLPMLEPDTRHVEQLTMLLGKDTVLTFQDGLPGDCLSPVRARLRESKGQIRRRGPDYLAYALIDAVVDGYFPLTDSWSHRLEALEDQLELDPDDDELIGEVRGIRREAVLLRRTIRHMRESLSFLARSSSPLIAEETRPYLRDCLDHTVELHEELEHVREWTSELLNSHQSLLGQRTNDAMQTLTVIATIFIPLSFVAGLYGMNFDTSSPWNMPELQWKYGYPMVLSVMATIGCGFLVYFRRKSWL